MNKAKLKSYAPAARRDFIQAVTDRAHFFGLSASQTIPVEESGDVAIIGGRPFPRAVAAQRRKLDARVKRDGFSQAMEAVAYTWFNRFLALRYMELHGYLEHGFRVLSNTGSSTVPEILDHAAQLDLPGLNKQIVIELKLDGSKDAELYRLLLVAQCNCLHAAMPFLFEKIEDETELLLPDNLLHSDSLIRKLVTDIDEEDWQEVEIIGWLYQFYISEKKDQVIGSVVKSEDIPAATQLFTPNWIVKYMVQNSLGRKWLATYPDSSLKAKMEYYIEPAEQTEEVRKQLAEITPESLDPENITLLDPASGSGHILVEAYDVFKEIYLERGYSNRDFPRLILEKNLFGLDIDDRAAQMAGFALLMKARKDDRRILQSNNPVKLNVMAIQESGNIDFDNSLWGEQATSIKELIELFHFGKTFGSLIRVPEALSANLLSIESTIRQTSKTGDLYASQAASALSSIVEQAKILDSKYDCVVANPPYMGGSYYTPILKEFVNIYFEAGKADLYGCFTERNLLSCKRSGYSAMITIPNWMFLGSFETLRNKIIKESYVSSLLHNGRGVFGSDFGSCAFVLGKTIIKGFKGSYKKLFEKQGSVSDNNELSNNFFSCKNHIASASDFESVPGTPIAYWIKNFSAFKGRRFDSLFVPGGRWKTHGDSAFTRFWWEVDCSSRRWKGYLKGGEFRPFFGNEYHVFDFSPSAVENYSQHGGACNKIYWSKQGITWSLITVSSNSFRIKRGTYEHSSGSPTIFLKTSDERTEIIALAILNSRSSRELLQVLNPTVNLTVSDVLKIPFPELQCDEENFLYENGKSLVDLYQWIWDLNEFSYGYAPFATLFQNRDLKILNTYNAHKNHLNRVQEKIIEIQNGVDELVANRFGMNLDSSDNTELVEQMLLCSEPKFSRAIMSLVIGCMMGRYSIDQSELVYAHSGNTYFDKLKYPTFPADDDGIVPVMDMDWFPDDAASRFEEFLKVSWSPETLEENLKFVADSLSPKGGETSRETIRRYVSNQFYKDHLQTYKKRPIYWLFSSGKQRAFECLVYLHRYNESTLSRMRNEYVTPLQGKFSAQVDYLINEVNAATSTAERNRLQKQLDSLRKKQVELAAFDELLRHYADQRISLDLDDGVKVNYGKFGALLAEVKAVTGGSE